MLLSMPSKYSLLLLQYSIITALLFSSSLSYVCVTQDKLSEEDLTLYTKMVELHKNETNMISTTQFGKLLVSPDDNSKVLKLQILASRQQELVDRIEITQLYSAKDSALAGNPRFVPTLFKFQCVTMEDGNLFVIQIFERFRGSLKSAVTSDPRFGAAMKKLSDRVGFYSSMMTAFAEVAKLKLKHCTLEPENLLYREYELDWSADYSQGQQPLTYFPVVTNVKYSTNWDQGCKGSAPAYADPDDFENDVKFFDADRAKVEVFSMALIIFYMETYFLQNNAKYEDMSGDFQSKFKTLNKYSTQLVEYIGNNGAFNRMKIGPIFESVTDILMQMNKYAFQYSFELLKADLKFVISGMNIYNEFLLTLQGADRNQVLKLQAQYKIFTDVLLAMVGQNNTHMDKRISTSDVIKKFTKVKANAISIEATINVRRTNLVLI